MDLFEEPGLKDPVSAFVQLLWERGNAYESQVIVNLKEQFIDLSGFYGKEKESKTLEAMDAKAPLIYSGRIAKADLVGEPDLLQFEDCGYVPGDIKSGSGEEGPDDNSRPKPHYAVQLGLYVDILQKQGRLSERRGFIWDIHGQVVPYDFTAMFGVRNPRTMWQDYEECLEEARAIISKKVSTLPALGSICKLCHWRTQCYDRLTKADDLTLIPELGRSRRDSMAIGLATVKTLAAADISALVKGKKTVFPGVGPDMLSKFKDRAVLLSTPGSKPYTRQAITLPEFEVELFFDIETDPMQDICYLHGFVIRQGRDNASERFVYFFAADPTSAAEEKVFREAWEFLKSQRPCAVYYYSSYEKTFYNALQRKYPHVCTSEEIEVLFSDSGTVDLYTSIVKRYTEWPTHDQSIKTLAKVLGFKWRDSDPSGAASIEWYSRWVKTMDPEIKSRILAYNEDDCRATRFLVDGLRTLPIKV
jgi:predicted RecB family nuclease